MRYSPHQVTKDFEAALCDYTSAPYAVAVTSCTMALLLACRWCYVSAVPPGASTIEIPKRTYVSVPMSIRHAGFYVSFRDEDWLGAYQLKPYPVWDSARYFTSRMFADNRMAGAARAPEFVCVSFHTSKILGDTQGGAILHNDPEADAWFRRARFDGRREGVAPKDDEFDMLGYHCYMSPDVSARLLWALSVLPQHNEPLPNSDYPDLSKMSIFK